MNSREESMELEDLKAKLDSWKYLLLPVNNLLEWEHKYAPFLIISFNLLVFGLIWFYNPSLLTIVAIFGLITLLIETAIPFLVSYFFKSNEWYLNNNLNNE